MNWIRWLVVLALMMVSLWAWTSWKAAGLLRMENNRLAAELQSAKEQQRLELDSQSRQRTAEVERLRAEAEEVHKLRNEVRQLRSGVSESEKLRAENQKLKAAAALPRPAAAAASAPKDQFPRDSWSFAGYGTPEAALISAIWSMREGNPKTYLESLSPEEQLRMAQSWQNKAEVEIAAKHQQDVAMITGLRILEQQSLSPGEVQMKIYIEGAERLETVTLRQVGSEWKFGGFIRPAK